MFTHVEKYSIKSCWAGCPLFGKTPGPMECMHPYWKNKEYRTNMIITHENSHDTIPEKCPLRIMSLQVIKTFSLDI